MIWQLSTWMISLATLLMVIDANGALVQITLEGNFIDQNENRVNRDLTGDGVPDIVWLAERVEDIDAEGVRLHFPDIIFSPVFAGVLESGGIAGTLNTAAVRISPSPRVSGWGASTSILGESAQVSGLLNVGFNDPAFGGELFGWLQIDASALCCDRSGEGGAYSLTLSRLIWDEDGNEGVPQEWTNLPVGEIPTYPEALRIPEPSAYSLIGFVAAAMLIRRSRYRRSTENKMEQNDR